MDSPTHASYEHASPTATPEAQRGVQRRRGLQKLSRGRKALFVPSPRRSTSARTLLVKLLSLLLAAMSVGICVSVIRPRWSRPDTLVVYIFSATDPEYIHNLEYFVKEGMAANDRCYYVVVVQQPDEGGTALPTLPDLPANAQYVNHPNECYDWGTFGWLLDSGLVNSAAYRFFILMNSSVRGPFFPPALQNTMHWTEPLLSKLGGDVKLVGPAISCEGSPWHGDAAGEWRRNPHVQSYLVATDTEGLRVWREEGNVLGCHSDRWDAIWHSELGSSAAILRAGFNLDTLMLRYQGVDWRDEAAWGCNGARSPAGNHYYDGVELDAYEVLFIKFKSYHMHDQASVMRAAKYQAWQQRRPITGGYGLVGGMSDGSGAATRQADADLVGAETGTGAPSIGRHDSGQRGRYAGRHRRGEAVEPLVQLASERATTGAGVPFPFDQIPDEVWSGGKAGGARQRGRLRAHARLWVHEKARQVREIWRTFTAPKSLELAIGRAKGPAGLLLGAKGVVQGVGAGVAAAPRVGSAAAGSKDAVDIAAVMRQQVLANAYALDRGRFTLAAMLDAAERGPGCFSFEVYLRGSPDLSSLGGDLPALWSHWLERGQFEDRPFKFTCPRDYSIHPEAQGLEIPSGALEGTEHMHTTHGANA